MTDDRSALSACSDASGNKGYAERHLSESLFFFFEIRIFISRAYNQAQKRTRILRIMFRHVKFRRNQLRPGIPSGGSETNRLVGFAPTVHTIPPHFSLFDTITYYTIDSRMSLPDGRVIPLVHEPPSPLRLLYAALTIANATQRSFR
jgi:hypothetical protein